MAEDLVRSCICHSTYYVIIDIKERQSTPERNYPFLQVEKNVLGGQRRLHVTLQGK